MWLPSDIILFNQVCPLTAIEPSYNIERRVIECYRSVKVPSRIQRSNLSPYIAANIIDFTLIHWFTGQRTSNCVNLWTVTIHENRGQCVCSSLENHIATLDEALVNEFVAVFCCFAGLAAACKENATLFVFNRHEVSWNFDVNYVRAIGMWLEVVHEQVMSIVNEEM